jgi:hypothetical protein
MDNDALVESEGGESERGDGATATPTSRANLTTLQESAKNMNLPSPIGAQPVAETSFVLEDEEVLTSTPRMSSPGTKEAPVCHRRVRSASPVSNKKEWTKSAAELPLAAPFRPPFAALPTRTQAGAPVGSQGSEACLRNRVSPGTDCRRQCSPLLLQQPAPQAPPQQHPQRSVPVRVMTPNMSTRAGAAAAAPPPQPQPQPRPPQQPLGSFPLAEDARLTPAAAIVCQATPLAAPWKFSPVPAPAPWQLPPKQAPHIAAPHQPPVLTASVGALPAVVAQPRPESLHGRSGSEFSIPVHPPPQQPNPALASPRGAKSPSKRRENRWV